MEIKKQLSVFMENKAGNLAKFSALLEESGIAILGISVTDAVDHAVIRLVVDDPSKCTHILGDNGIVVIESDVLQVEVTSQPGELKRIAQILSQESINIDYIYGSESQGSGHSTLIFKVSDPKKGLEMMKKHLSH
ncbi:MAG: amino acid-binding protein [bacterium]|nr:MAG: amino acid-binding protein [bacterium]